MKFSVIVAIDNKNGFAKDNKIPWYFREDFIHFKDTTGTSPCVMGRHTYEEINEKLGDLARVSVLPNRKCYVLSHTLDYLPNATVIKSLDDIVDCVDDNMFLIGGKQLFDLGIKIADTIFITKIDMDYNCDIFFDFAYIEKNYKLINTRNSIQNDHIEFMVFQRNEDEHTTRIIE